MSNKYTIYRDLLRDVSLEGKNLYAFTRVPNDTQPNNIKTYWLSETDYNSKNIFGFLYLDNQSNKYVNLYTPLEYKGDTYNILNEETNPFTDENGVSCFAYENTDKNVILGVEDVKVNNDENDEAQEEEEKLYIQTTDKYWTLIKEFNCLFANKLNETTTAEFFRTPQSDIVYNEVTYRAFTSTDSELNTSEYSTNVIYLKDSDVKYNIKSKDISDISDSSVYKMYEKNKVCPYYVHVGKYIYKSTPAYDKETIYGNQLMAENPITYYGNSSINVVDTEFQEITGYTCDKKWYTKNNNNVYQEYINNGLIVDVSLYAKYDINKYVFNIVDVKNASMFIKNKNSSYANETSVWHNGTLYVKVIPDTGYHVTEICGMSYNATGNQSKTEEKVYQINSITKTFDLSAQTEKNIYDAYINFKSPNNSYGTLAVDGKIVSTFTSTSYLFKITHGTTLTIKVDVNSVIPSKAIESIIIDNNSSQPDVSTFKKDIEITSHRTGNNSIDCSINICTYNITMNPIENGTVDITYYEKSYFDTYTNPNKKTGITSLETTRVIGYTDVSLVFNPNTHYYASTDLEKEFKIQNDTTINIAFTPDTFTLNSLTYTYTGLIETNSYYQFKASIGSSSEKIDIILYTNK